MTPVDPTRDHHATLVDLLDRVLDKGIVINADIIISLSGVPLIGVNLRAALAGMETMVRYGVMRDWDERTRAWESEWREKKKLAITSGDEIVLEMLGAYQYDQGIYASWRMGRIYLMETRLVLCSAFEEVFFETRLDKIKSLVIERGETLTGRERDNLCLVLEGDRMARLQAPDTHKLREAIEGQMAALEISGS